MIWHLWKGTGTACGIKDPRKNALPVTHIPEKVDCRKCLKAMDGDR